MIIPNIWKTNKNVPSHQAVSNVQQDRLETCAVHAGLGNVCAKLPATGRSSAVHSRCTSRSSRFSIFHESVFLYSTIRSWGNSIRCSNWLPINFIWIWIISPKRSRVTAPLFTTGYMLLKFSARFFLLYKPPPQIICSSSVEINYPPAIKRGNEKSPEKYSWYKNWFSQLSISIPSGKLTVCYWKWSFTVNFPLKMVIFHSFLYVYQRVWFLFS